MIKHLTALLFIVLVCQATVVQEQAEEDLAAGLDLSENEQGSFLASGSQNEVEVGLEEQADDDQDNNEDNGDDLNLDLTGNQQGEFLADNTEGADVQATNLDDQLLLGGLFSKLFGHGRKWTRNYNPFYGGLAVTRYLTTSLTRNPIYFDVDDDYIYFNQIGDARAEYAYNYNDFDFRINGGWGDLTPYGPHYLNIGRLFSQTSRILFQNNFFRCYNRRNQVIIVIQRINYPYRVGGVWGVPRHRRRFSLFPRLSPYWNYPWA